MQWIDSEIEVKPTVGRNVIVFCPEWNASGYQICYWDGKTFRYEEQPNDDFHTYVNAWTLFMEAD
jgi:hypothetical protein